MPCPCCSGLSFDIIGSRERQVRRDTGETDRYVIRRLRCTGCRKIHHELPDFIIPYKRYDASVIEEGIWTTEPSVLPVDDSTLYRWKSWFYTLVEYWFFVCQSLLIQFVEEAPRDDLSAHSLPVFQRIGQWFGQGAGWLGKLVHPVANHNFWLHTRSACLSRNPCRTLQEKGVVPR